MTMWHPSSTQRRFLRALEVVSFLLLLVAGSMVLKEYLQGRPEGIGLKDEDVAFSNKTIRRRLQNYYPPQYEQQQQQQQQQPGAATTPIGASDSTPAEGNTFMYGLPGSAAEWCSPPILPPLPYEQCKKKQNINSVPLYGGLTNSLKMVLLGTILSFEEDTCFYVDESQSELIQRGDRSEALDSFINRYFEPIGLSAKDPIVTRAKSNYKVEVKDWTKVWEETRARRMYGQLSDIPSLGYKGIEGHLLKRIMLRRMWRPLPHIREETCSGLAGHGLQDEFMTFSVRRGDKASEEHFAYATAQQYIDVAEQAIPTHFDGRPPKIFVATDDCTVLPEFRQLRPTWTFVSECDKQQVKGHSGFALADMTQWSQSDTDAHYRKFFIELYAMATSKYFVGVWYTNVSWFAQFMRGPDRTSFIMLDTPGTDGFALDWN